MIIRDTEDKSQDSKKKNDTKKGVTVLINYDN